MGLFAELRAAVLVYDDWPGSEARAQVIEAARRFVQAVDQRAAMIEQMRQTITPTDQALAELLEQ
jgi:hypothetical protein